MRGLRLVRWEKPAISIALIHTGKMKQGQHVLEVFADDVDAT
jgi:hypothetical protein